MSKLSPQPWLYAALMPSTLFIAVFLFFGISYPNHLHFQEQYQLFLFDKGYIADILSIPGGVADMAGRFLTQFFLWGWVGATIVAILITGVFLLTLRTVKSGWLRGISMLPAVALWIFFCDENALLGAIVAVLLAQMSNWGLSAINNKRIRIALYILTAPVLYWALGPIAIIVGALYLVTSIYSRDKEEIYAAIGSLVIVAVMPIIAQYWVAIPLERLYLAPHYYRDLSVLPYVLGIAVAGTIIVAIIPTTLESKWKSIAIWALAIISSGYAVKRSYNGASEDVMSYDFMCRFQLWNRLTDTADKKKPKNSLSCTALNLALGMKGQLGDRMFEYNQNGLAGLLPNFERDPVSPLTTSEAYYQLGMINTAQRLVFESQEAIQDFQKSGRCYKRLAETNLINGNYEVARKYLLALSKTLFYSTWAKEVLSLLYNEEAIAQHKEYGRLRKLMPKEDHFFQDSDIAEVLGRQVTSNGTNQLAYEYMQCAYLLTGELDSFVNHLEMGSNIKYQRMPYMFQQAYGLWWSRTHKPQEQMPAFISSNIISGMNQFFGAVQQSPNNKAMLSSRFGNTYWYYYIIH